MITRTCAQAVWMLQNIGANLRKPKPPAKRGGPATLLTEAEVLECRARHEFAGWTPLQCSSWYGPSVHYMRRLLAYEVRSRLYAEPRHANLEPGK